MKYHTLFFRKLGKMLENLSSAAVVIGALRDKYCFSFSEDQFILNSIQCRPR